MTKLAWRFRRFANRDHRTSSLACTLRAHRRVARGAALLVQVAYFFPITWALGRISRWDSLVLVEVAERLWPVAWLDWVDAAVVGRPLYAALLIGMAVSALLCRFRAARIVHFVCLLELLALEFSFGKIHHLMHGWLFASFVWMFLPRGFEAPDALGRSARHGLVLLFGGMQLLVAMTYSSSGVGKWLGGLYQLAVGEPSVFQLDALARHVADRIQFTGEPSVLGGAVVELGPFGWPLLIGNLYFQTLALWFALRPRAHRTLAAYLVLFHLSSALVLTIDFSPQVLLVGVLFALSPFAPERRQGLAELALQALPRVPRQPAAGARVSGGVNPSRLSEPSSPRPQG